MSRGPVVLGTDEKLFDALHRRLVDREHSPPPWDALDLRSLENRDELREQVRLAWSARVTAEYRSMVVFGELLARMPELRLPLEVSSSAARLITDEARHTEYCARLAAAFGGHRDAQVSEPELRLVDDNLSARLFVARWTASMFCVGECASVGLLHTLHDHSDDPCVRAVLAVLRRDEALHDRFGWALARAVFPSLSDDELDWLAADLASSFAHYERSHARGFGPELCTRPASDFAPRAGLTGADAVLPRFGLPPRESYARAFYDRVDNVILPSLAALRVPAYEAWALRHEAGALAGVSTA